VTKNPPTTFIIAQTTAIKPSHIPILPSRVVAKTAPMIAIPEIAFEPDIRGVCNVGGTFVIISNPTKTARIKIVIVVISI